MEKHNPPTYHTTSFDCPHCSVYSQQKWLGFNQMPAIYEYVKGIEIAWCVHCKETTIWKLQTLIYPTASIAPQPSPDMPEDVAADYNEACAVLAYSPRSSAALLRLALQKLCIFSKVSAMVFCGS